MVTIDKSYMLTAEEAKKVTYGTGNTKEFLCIHTTDNYKEGAKALNHALLQKNGNSRQASWQYQVDDIKAYQSFPNNYRCWHAGVGNNKSIAIEICVDKGSDWNKTMRNAVQLAAKILKDEKIPISKMVQHNYFTGKNCPRDIREGKGGWTWKKFVAEVKKELNKSSVTQVSKPNKPSKPTQPKVIGTIKVLVDDLNYYNSPRWSKPTGTVDKNTVLTIVDKVKVDGAYQYKTVSGTYITASTKYVSFKSR